MSAAQEGLEWSRTENLSLGWRGCGAGGRKCLRRRLQDAATSLGIRGALYRSMVLLFVFNGRPDYTHTQWVKDQHDLTAPPHAACRPHAPRVPVSRRRVRARCLSPGEAAECPPPSREAYALGSGAGWFRPHHLPQVESVELVSRFWRRARPAVFERLPFSAVLWLAEGGHSRPSSGPWGVRHGGWSGPAVTPQA